VKTNKLINLLAEDFEPRWSFARILSLAVGCAVLVAGSAFFLGLGFRTDIWQALESVRCLFKFVVTAIVAVSATGALLRMGRPDGEVAGWRWALTAVPVLLLCAVGAELVAVPERAWMTRLVGHNARFCLTLIPLLAVGPFTCLFVALRRGAPTSPRLAGALAGLAASSIAATFYAANCNDDSPLFVATWYPIATLVVVLTGYVAGNRFLRW
jgi:hypothetical protein